MVSTKNSFLFTALLAAHVVSRLHNWLYTGRCKHAETLMRALDDFTARPESPAQWKRPASIALSSEPQQQQNLEDQEVLQRPKAPKTVTKMMKGSRTEKTVRTYGCRIPKKMTR